MRLLACHAALPPPLLNRLHAPVERVDLRPALLEVVAAAAAPRPGGGHDFCFAKRVGGRHLQRHTLSSGNVCDPGWHPDEAGRLEAIMSFRELFFCLHNKMGMISVFTRVGTRGGGGQRNKFDVLPSLVGADLGDSGPR